MTTLVGKQTTNGRKTKTTYAIVAKYSATLRLASRAGSAKLTGKMLRINITPVSTRLNGIKSNLCLTRNRESKLQPGHAPLRRTSGSIVSLSVYTKDVPELTSNGKPIQKTKLSKLAMKQFLGIQLSSTNQLIHF